MHSLWYRFKYSVQSDLENLFDKQEEKNPIEKLNQYLRESEKQTKSVGKLLERQGKLKVVLQKELLEAEVMLKKRRHQLELTQTVDEKDLITFAENEIVAYESRAATLSESILNTTNELISLERKFEEMKHKVKDMKVRQLQLMGKENVTRAHHRMDQFIFPEDAKNEVKTAHELNKYIESLGEQVEREPETSSLESRLEELETSTKRESNIV